MAIFTKYHLPGDPEEWDQFKKKTRTRAIRMDKPFVVETIHSGLVTCEDGWLALDNQGHPYPIDAKEFDTIYEKVEE